MARWYKRCRAGAIIMGAACALGCPSDTLAQPVRAEADPEIKAPEVGQAHGNAPAVQRLLDAPYNTDDDRARIRVMHGQWTAADLGSIEHLSFAALSVGDFERVMAIDETKQELSQSARYRVLLDKAEAMCRLGKYSEFFDHLDTVDAQLTHENMSTHEHMIRSHYLRATALELLGDSNGCRRVLLGARETVREIELSTPAELVYFARINHIASRVLSQSNADGANYDAIMRTLGRARTGAGATYWPAMLAEAEVLIEKGNPAQAQKAVREVLELQPQSERAIGIVGRMSVGGFNFDQAEAMASHLDMLHYELASLVDGKDAVNTGGKRHSIEGQTILALAALRRNDADAVGDAVEKIFDRAPDSIEGRALQAAEAAERFDFANAKMILDTLDARASELANIERSKPMRGYMIVGAATSENRQYADAARFLREAAARSPFDAEPVIDLGLLQVQAGRDEAALGALEAAVALDPFNLRARNSLKLMQQLQSHATVQSAHFRVRYQPMSGPNGTRMHELVANEMLPVLEKIHARVCGDEPGGIDYIPENKTLIELLPDHATFAVRIAGMPKLHTFAASTGPIIAMEAPRAGVGGSIGTYDWPRVIQHEYTHTVTLARTNNRIPHWFTEAAAVYLEDAPRDYDRAQLLTRALLEDGLFTLDEISIKFVRPEKPTDRSLAYAQGHWMYEFLVERFGDEAPRQLMDQYAAGLNEASAFEAILHLPRDVFFSQFQAWAREDVIAWGMVPAEGTPTLEALIETLDADERERASKDARQISAHTLETLQIQHPDHPQLVRVQIAHAMKIAEQHASGDAALDDPELRELLVHYAELRPVDSMPHQKLAAYWLNTTQRTNALEHLAYLDVREQHSPAYAIERAKLSVEAGRWDDAASASLRAVRIAPYDATTRELASRIALQRRDLETAAHHIEALTRIEPDREIHQRRLDRIREMIADR